MTRCGRLLRRTWCLIILLLTAAGVVAVATPASAEPPPSAGSAAAGPHTITPALPTVVRIGQRRERVGKTWVTVPTITVRGPSSRAAAAIDALAAAQVRSGVSAFRKIYVPPKDHALGQEYHATAVVRANTTPVLAIVFDEETLYLADGWATRYHALVVDTRTGRRWTNAALASAIQSAARPGIDLLTAIRDSIGDRSLTPTLTLNRVTLVPTRAGLMALLDKCTVVCVAGPMSSTIPWSTLLAPGTRLPFAPW